MQSINSREDIIASLDNEFEGIIPDHDEPNHAALGFAVGNALGVLQPEIFDDATQRAAEPLSDAIGEPDHIVLLLLDGFGMNFVNTLQEDSYVRRNVTATISSTLPTSTGPNLMALATGRWPGAHGNLGWDVHIPRLGERIQPLPWRLTRTGQSLSEIGFSPMEMLLAPPIPFGNTGAFTFVINEEIAGSATSQMYGQTDTAGFSYDRDPITHIVDSVLDGISHSKGKTFTYVYWTEVDSCAHKNGEMHPITRVAVLRAAALAEALGTALTGKARFIATADHGHLDSPAGVWSTIRQSDAISQHLTCVPSGEPRTLFFHLKPGEERAFEASFEDRFADRFALMPSATAIDLGLFGPVDLVSDASRARMGDFFAISRGRWSIFASDNEEGETVESMHGGITVAESIVPLIVV